MLNDNWFYNNHFYFKSLKNIVYIKCDFECSIALYKGNLDIIYIYIYTQCIYF